MTPHPIRSSRPHESVLPRAHTDESHRRRAYGKVLPMDRPRKPGVIRDLLRIYRKHEGRSFWADLAVVGGFLIVVVLAIVVILPLEVVNVGAGM